MAQLLFVELWSVQLLLFELLLEEGLKLQLMGQKWSTMVELLLVELYLMMLLLVKLWLVGM